MVHIALFLTFLMTALLNTSAFSADFLTGWDANEKKDFSTVLKEWVSLAEQGYVDAQYNLGVLYDHGEEIPQDYNAALKWYNLATEQGNSVVAV